MPAIVAMLQEDGLTIGEVLADIPHDASAFVVYAFIFGFVYFVWRGSRGSARKEDAGTGPDGSAGSSSS